MSRIRYQYIIFNRRTRSAIRHQHTSWEFRPLDLNLMKQGAKFLLGTHDFTSYRAKHCQAKNPVRTIQKLALSQQGDNIYIDIQANAFLQQMVRNIAGSLMEVGMKKHPPEWINTALLGKNRCLAGKTAPSEGLYFVQAMYDEKYQLPYKTPAV